MDPITSTLISIILTKTLKIGLIIAVTFFAFLFLNMLINQLINKIAKNSKKTKRIKTIKQVFSGTARFVIVLVSLLMILSEFGVNIAPILASVGLVGLAISMGSREIISDFLSGMLILIDNVYQVGDEIKVIGIEGRVKSIDLRKTIIIDKENKTHIIPNGRIKEVTKNE